MGQKKETVKNGTKGMKANAKWHKKQTILNWRSSIINQNNKVFKKAAIENSAMKTKVLFIMYYINNF